MLHQMFLYSETDGFSNGCPWKGNPLAGKSQCDPFDSFQPCFLVQMFLRVRFCFALSVQLQWFGRVSGAEEAKESIVLSGDKIHVRLQREGSVFFIRGKSNLEIMWLQSLETELNFGAPFLVMLVWIQRVVGWENKLPWAGILTAREMRIRDVNQEKATEIWKQVDLRKIERIVRKYDPNCIYYLRNIYAWVLYIECVMLYQHFRRAIEIASWS